MFRCYWEKNCGLTASALAVVFLHLKDFTQPLSESILLTIYIACPFISNAKITLSITPFDKGIS